jgi:hypothetical protein
VAHRPFRDATGAKNSDCSCCGRDTRKGAFANALRGTVNRTVLLAVVWNACVRTDILLCNILVSANARAKYASPRLSYQTILVELHPITIKYVAMHSSVDSVLNGVAAKLKYIRRQYTSPKLPTWKYTRTAVPDTKHALINAHFQFYRILWLPLCSSRANPARGIFFVNPLVARAPVSVPKSLPCNVLSVSLSFHDRKHTQRP